MSLSLRALQLAFMKELSGKHDEAFRESVVDNTLDGRMNKARRIDIYRLNHIGARVKGLNNVYPVCLQILGEKLFERLAEDYVATHRSIHWDLNFHGADFSEFLAQKTAQIPQLNELFYLGELARLEWLFHICYYAGNNERPMVNADVTPEQLRFRADVSLQLFETQWPVYQIWRNNRDGIGEAEVIDDAEHYYQVVFRRQYQPRVDTLTAAHFALLQDSIDGKTLGELAERHGEIVGSAIPAFIEQGYLSILV